MPTKCTLSQDTVAILKPVCLGKIPLSVKGPVWGMIVNDIRFLRGDIHNISRPVIALGTGGLCHICHFCTCTLVESAILLLFVHLIWIWYNGLNKNNRNFSILSCVKHQKRSIIQALLLEPYFGGNIAVSITLYTTIGGWLPLALARVVQVEGV